jgi:hypothetical protein
MTSRHLVAIARGLGSFIATARGLVGPTGVLSWSYLA